MKALLRGAPQSPAPWTRGQLTPAPADLHAQDVHTQDVHLRPHSAAGHTPESPGPGPGPVILQHHKAPPQNKGVPIKPTNLRSSRTRRKNQSTEKTRNRTDEAAKRALTGRLLGYHLHLPRELSWTHDHSAQSTLSKPTRMAQRLEHTLLNTKGPAGTWKDAHEHEPSSTRTWDHQKGTTNAAGPLTSGGGTQWPRQFHLTSSSGKSDTSATSTH